MLNHRKPKAILQNQQNTKKRSKLATANFIKWIRTRYQNQNRRNLSYMYFPHELTRQKSIEKIFHQFDVDGSGGLSRDEVFDMFNSFGIPITMQNLNDLYDSVQVNLEELDCQMFKKCALSEKSNKVFRGIIKEMDKDGTADYMPHNFTNMIIYLVFLSKRDELRKNLNFDKTKIGIKDQVKQMQSLLELEDLSLNNQRLNTHIDAFQKSLKTQFKDIWQRVNERHGHKFAHCPKLQQQFYEFYKKKMQASVSNKTLGILEQVQ